MARNTVPARVRWVNQVRAPVTTTASRSTPSSATSRIALFFNAFPLPQRESGTRQTLRYIGSLLSSGFSVLIFPEGTSHSSPELAPLRTGMAL